jgi:hypothetical protein
MLDLERYENSRLSQLGATTLSIVTPNIMALIIKTLGNYTRHNDTQAKNTQYIDTHQNVTEQKDIEHNNTQCNITKHQELQYDSTFNILRLSIMTLSIITQSIMTLSIMTLITMKLSKTVLFLRMAITTALKVPFLDNIIILLNVIMLSFIMLNVMALLNHNREPQLRLILVRK